MTIKTPFLTLLLATAAIVIPMSAAQADVPSPFYDDPVIMTVTDRPQADFDPIGFYKGTLHIMPSIILSEEYNDNVFASDTNEESDFITVVKPVLAIDSNTESRRLVFGASADAGFYADETDENYLDGRISGGGRFRLNSRNELDVFVTGQRLHEFRSEESNIAVQKEPTEYNYSYAYTEWRYRPNRFQTSLSLGYEWFGYDNGENRVGGATIVQDDRDRSRIYAGGRLDYQVTSDWNAFTSLDVNTVDYRRNDFNTGTGLYDGIERDSDGYQALVGFTFNRLDLIGLEAGVGYLSQEYDNNALQEVDGVAAMLHLDWNVTRLTSISADFDRKVRETISAGASGYLSSKALLRADHELLRNVIVGAEMSFENRDYETISRDDDILSIGADVDYKLSPRWHATARYAFEDRDSNLAGLDYSQNRFILGIKANF